MLKVFLIQIVFLFLFKVNSSNSQQIGEKYIIGKDEDVLYYEDIMKLANESGLSKKCDENIMVQRIFKKKITFLIKSSQVLFVILDNLSRSIIIDFFGFVDKDFNIINWGDTKLAFRVYRLSFSKDNFCVFFKDLNGKSVTSDYFFSFSGSVVKENQNQNRRKRSRSNRSRSNSTLRLT